MKRVIGQKFSVSERDVEIRCETCNEVVGVSDWDFGITCPKCHLVLSTGGAIFRAEGFPEVLRVSHKDLDKISFFHKEFRGIEGAIVKVDKKFWELEKETGLIKFDFDMEEEASDDKDI